MQKDPAHAADRPIARRHRYLDDRGPATLEHAAHARERLVLSEVGSLLEQARPMLAAVRTPIIRAIAGFE